MSESTKIAKLAGVGFRVTSLGFRGLRRRLYCFSGALGLLPLAGLGALTTWIPDNISPADMKKLATLEGS